MYDNGALFGANEKINLIYIFNATYNLWDNDIVSFAYAIFVGMLLGGILGVLIMYRLKRKICNEYNKVTNKIRLAFICQ